jgi:citrate synthase
MSDKPSHAVDTAISRVFPDRILVRGYNLVDLAATRSFGDVVYVLLRGELPAGHEGELIEAMLSVMVEHSINAPSTFAARTAANAGTPLQGAVAAGVLTIGENHGGAGEECARILQEAVASVGGDSILWSDPASVGALAVEVVATSRAAGKRLPGFGHRVHDPDPRAAFLLGKAHQLGIAGPHTMLAEALVDALKQQSGRSLPLNVDGALGALISDMGFDYRMGKGLFILARTAGLLAHVQEEMETGKPFQFAPRVATNWTGAEERPLP